MIARFVWTLKGKLIHVSDDGVSTRCGRGALVEVNADDVAWMWPPCVRCVDPNREP